MNEQPLKTSGADVLFSRKKTQKNLSGGWHPTPPLPLYVRGLNPLGKVGLKKWKKKGSPLS